MDIDIDYIEAGVKKLKQAGIFILDSRGLIRELDPIYETIAEDISESLYSLIEEIETRLREEIYDATV